MEKRAPTCVILWTRHSSQNCPAPSHSPGTFSWLEYSTSVEQLQPFERGRIVCLREAGWTYQRIAAHVGHNVSVVCCCFQQWSVEHSHTRTPGSGRPRSTDKSTSTHCASSDGLRPEQHPGKKSRHMLHLLCHQVPFGNRLLASVLRSHIPLARLSYLHKDTAKQGDSGVVKELTGEWKGGTVVFSDESRICLYESDGHTNSYPRE